MVSRLPCVAGEKTLVFCDESQNLPPVALCSLAEQVSDKHFIACIDSEQCLLTSPFILSYLKLLLHRLYGAYQEHHLPRTWRCPPEVVRVANNLMDAKYRMDGSGQRRIYARLESIHAEGGDVNWVHTKEGLIRLRHFSSFAYTVVIVGQEPTPELRKEIRQKLQTDNILTAAQAIGLDFSVVILWKPFSADYLKNMSRKTDSSGLMLEEWNALNGLYVALTRAQKAVFIYETAKPYIDLGKRLLGTNSFENLVTLLPEECSESAKKAEWEQHVTHHLNEKRYELASNIMRTHLQLSEDAIQKKIQATQQKHAPVTQLIPVQKTPSMASASLPVVVEKIQPKLKVTVKNQEINERITKYINGILNPPVSGKLSPLN
jgi:hypothetical protein